MLTLALSAMFIFATLLATAVLADSAVKAWAILRGMTL